MEKPTYMYRRDESGGIEKRVFEADAIPEGWVDSPAKVDEPAPEPESGPAPKKERKGK